LRPPPSPPLRPPNSEGSRRSCFRPRWLWPLPVNPIVESLP